MGQRDVSSKHRFSYLTTKVYSYCHQHKYRIRLLIFNLLLRTKCVKFQENLIPFPNNYIMQTKRKPLCTYADSREYT